MIFTITTIERIDREEERHTIEVKQKEDDNDHIGNECDNEVGDTLSEKKLPERRPARRYDQSNRREHQDNQVK